MNSSWFDVSRDREVFLIQYNIDSYMTHKVKESLMAVAPLEGEGVLGLGEFTLAYLTTRNEFTRRKGHKLFNLSFCLISLLCFFSLLCLLRLL